MSAFPPSHTTIDTAEASNAIRFYSPDAVLTKSENSGNLYGVTGTVELMFNYANGTQAERDWVDGISSVVLLQDDESNSELNTNLTWELDKAYPHGKAVDGVQPTVACIKVPIGQINFYSQRPLQAARCIQRQSRAVPHPCGKRKDSFYGPERHERQERCQHAL